jgi:hypothetical protein
MRECFIVAPRVNQLGKSRHSRNVFIGLPSRSNLLRTVADLLVLVPLPLTLITYGANSRRFDVPGLFLDLRFSVRSTGNINSPVPEEFQPDQNYCEPETEDKIVGRQSI